MLHMYVAAAFLFVLWIVAQIIAGGMVPAVHLLLILTCAALALAVRFDGKGPRS